MIKAWLNMWKNAFNYTGTVSRKEYWMALIMNVIAMYVGVVPYALILVNFTDDAIMVSAVYVAVFFVPMLSIYFRRARELGWKTGTAIYLAFAMPLACGIVAGIISHCGTVDKKTALIYKIFALSFALFFYGGMLGLAIYGDSTAIPALPTAGLLLGTADFIFLVVPAVFFPRQQEGSDKD